MFRLDSCEVKVLIPITITIMIIDLIEIYDLVFLVLRLILERITIGGFVSRTFRLCE